MAKELNKMELSKAFIQIFTEFNTRIVDGMFYNCYSVKSGLVRDIDIPIKKLPRLNNNSKTIFHFIVGCHARNGNFNPIEINNSRIQKGINVTMSCRTIYNHINLLIEAGVLEKGFINKEIFTLCISDKLRNMQLKVRSDDEKKQEYTQLLTAYKSDIVKKLDRNIFPTCNISYRDLNKKRGVEKIELKNTIEEIQSSSSSIFATKKVLLKDTEKNVRFETERNIQLMNYPDSSVNTGGRDFSFIQEFLMNLVPLLYKHLHDYQRQIIINAILIFNSPQQQNNAIRTIYKVHYFLKQNPDFKLHSPEKFFDQTNKIGFFTALKWPDYELINKRRNQDFIHVKTEVVHAKKLYYDNGLDIDRVIKQAQYLCSKYHDDPIKQKYIRKSLLPFIESKNNLFINPNQSKR